jgi:parallel beta-helix repeat protein
MTLTRVHAAPIAVAAAAAIWILAPAGGHAGPTVPVSCGDVITKDTQIANDLEGCPGDGLVIGADNITLDLNGHTIDGVSVEDTSGVRNEGHEGVTVTNGTLREFGDGVFAKKATGTRLHELASSDNRFSGIVLIESGRTVVSGSRISHNGEETELVGILVTGSDKSTIRRNTLVANGGSGIQVLESKGARVVKNSVSRTGETGIDVTASSNTVVKKNFVHRNVAGIVVGKEPDDPRRAVGNRIVKNVVVVNSDLGIIVVNGVRDTVVRGNRASRNGGIGIGLIEGATRGTVIARNAANRNGAAGITVEHPATTLTRNTANRNHDLGIDAVPGVTDGGGNRARGNANPAQCTGVLCK